MENNLKILHETSRERTTLIYSSFCENFSDDSNNEPPPAQVTCSEGYTPYWYECFKLDQNPRNWYQANEECESQLAFLPSIHSDAENAVLHLMVLRSGSPVWLGLRNWEVCLSVAIWYFNYIDLCCRCYEPLIELIKGSLVNFICKAMLKSKQDVLIKITCPSKNDSKQCFLSWLLFPPLIE